MDFSLGSIYNSAVTLGLGVSSEEKEGTTSLKGFLQTMTKMGVQVKSNFEADYIGFTGLKFLIQSITTPGLKTNNGSIYYKTREIQLPVTYEQEHNFSMTVLNDGNGFVYTQLRNILMNDYANRKVKSSASMTITTHGDGQNTNGMKIEMNGVRFTNISGLDYNHSDNTLQTFNVECTAATIDFSYGEIEKKEGLLGAVDKIGGAINNILGG